MEKFPIYMYHKAYDEPRRVDNNSEKVDLENQGWTSAYIHKSYPKWVNGVIVRNKKEHDLLLGKEEEKEEKIVKVAAEKVAVKDDGTTESLSNYHFKVFKKESGQRIENMQYKTKQEALTAIKTLTDRTGEKKGTYGIVEE